MGLLAWAVASLCALVTVHLCMTCDKHYCSSQVSKCQLLKHCNCNVSDTRNCSCCNDCQFCLQEYYFDCCSCIGLCPESDDDDWSPFASTVADLTVTVTGLFELLTAPYASHRKFTSLTYPAVNDLNLMVKSDNMGGARIITEQEGESVSVAGDAAALRDANCTVAFGTSCMPLAMCRQFCSRMGASKFRFFQDSFCCHCVGSTCIGYGPRQPMCANCTGSYYNSKHAPSESSASGAKRGADTKPENSAVVDEAGYEEQIWDQYQKDDPGVVEMNTNP